jgi:hypothetical protein
MGIQEILESRRKEILAIAARHGAHNVRVFGSIARGEATEESDVDFLVDVGPRHSSFFPGGLVADLEALLGRRVEVVEPEALHWYLRQRVLSEATPL